ncbi:hypothetical protein [Mesorhizobium sp. M5C.F.Ca.IN.020.32.2.1]|uniref:hypothetical protein n=1 Tax=Mesorhizobium sp. M5C.F.Ca.IN.020.32.2.1 TaxID=2496771 RepID=UPI000FD303A0|nr:hypothetical protein [Mesorhizobium sp. M5C.F.Ca.IN.020.32.2.1]RUV32466.1 hypothetical protein EOA86_02335 [Mesorhizobium sp. M5C.F.Ca.IN.020.32.2.1]
MTRSISADAVAAVEAAMARLLRETATGEELTVSRLAAEAGLSRATLYRAPELLARFREAAATRQPTRTPSAPVDRIRQLEAEIAALRGRETDELRALRTANTRMAQHIQALSLLVGELERRIAQLQAESPPDSLRVVRLAVPTSR